MGTLKTVFTFKLDRLCRSGVADTFAVVDELRRAGVTLIAVADNLTILPNKEDLTSEVLVFALGLAARLERTAINDRIASARARIEAEGGRWGRPSRVDTPTLERAKKMRLDGRSIRAIAAALKIPRSTIAGALAVSEKHALARPPENGRDRGRQQGVSR
jgi:DNA invertase Pin-like site-specific DNA recombinase